jgi:alpha-L-fucosidase
MVFSDIGPDMRWVGNENGIVGTTNWNLLDTAGFSRGQGAPSNDTLNQGNVNGKNWIPAECDVSIRPGWFYHAKEDSLVKSPEKLFDIYLKSVGRGANLILNVPPDPRGLISSYDSAALMGFAKLREESFSNDLLKKNKHSFLLYPLDSLNKINHTRYMMQGNDFKNEKLTIQFDDKQQINCIQLGEDLAFGQKVKSFSIEIYNNDSLMYKNSYTTIGHQRLISFPLQMMNRLVITIQEAKGAPVQCCLEIFRIPDELVEK